jgi:hypothetical protein
MRGGRHPASSLGTGVLTVTLVAILASGCGSSGTESSSEGSTKTAAPQGAATPACTAAPAGVGALRVSGVDCTTGREIVVAWTKKHACATPASASRTSCTVGAYRCLAATVQHGLAVSCARPDRSISFVSKRN